MKKLIEDSGEIDGKLIEEDEKIDRRGSRG
jgi:hypothetical protein